MNGVADELNVDDPPETEIMPGVFIQDFRNTGGSSKTKNEDIMNGMAAELNLDDDDKETTEAEIASLQLQREQLLNILQSPENIIKVIEADIAEIELQVFHLIRSNKELLEEMKTDPDPIYKEALEENIQVVLKKRNQLKELRKMKEDIEKDLGQLPSLLYLGKTEDNAPNQTPGVTTVTETITSYVEVVTASTLVEEVEEGIFL